MNYRAWMNQNPLAAGGAALGAILLAAAVAWWFWPAGSTQMVGGSAWFYDPGARTLIAGDMSQPPPLKAAVGSVPAGAVRAVVVACDDAGCGSEATRQVLYLYKWPDAIRDEAAAMLAGGASPHDMAAYYSQHDAEQLVTGPKNVRWVSKEDEAGARIVDRIATACGGESVSCHP